MEKIINKLIDEFIKGGDTYTHNGSTWLIFTESKQWVIELTDSKTLWYNYNFFKGMFAYTSMDVVENQHYITKWVEDNVINKNQVNLTKNKMSDFVSDSLIENGVKETRLEMNITEGEVDDIIQDGVKLTQYNDNENKSWVEGVIKEGVKETNHVDVMGFFNNKMEDTLQNGVRHILNTEYMPTSMVEDIIENGVKEIKTPGKDGDIMSTVEWIMENKSTSYTKMIDDVIDNGVKETQPLPDQSGELIGYGNYYHDKEDRTKAFYNYLEETIKFGVKES